MNSKLFSTMNGNVSRTANGAKTLDSSMNALVDLFGAIGSSRGKDVSVLFSRAFGEDPELTARIMLWCRDIRGGAGERQTFRNMLPMVESRDIDLAKKLVKKIPEVGRWDDLFSIYGKNPKLDKQILSLIVNTLNE